MTSLSEDYTSHTHYEGNLRPSAINFASTRSTDGGAINFYFNGPENDMTTSICEAEVGMLKINNNEILTKDHF